MDDPIRYDDIRYEDACERRALILCHPWPEVEPPCRLVLCRICRSPHHEGEDCDVCLDLMIEANPLVVHLEEAASHA